MSLPSVDVVIPAYNRKELLPRAVFSVLRQSYPRWLIFVVDDGSTDKTHELFLGPKALFKEYVRPAAGRPKIKLLRLNRQYGVSYARNQGIKQGQGEWIAFLDSDDEWLPEKLQKQMEYAKNRPERPLIHCNETWLKNGQTLAQKKKHKKQGGRIFSSAVELCRISPSASLVKRSFLCENGLFREDFPVCEDFELWLRLTSRCETGFLPQSLIIKHGGHKDQLSKKHWGMDYWRIKALMPFLKASHLSCQEQKALRKSLREKIDILIKGCKKHNNKSLLKQLAPLIKDRNLTDIY